MAALLSSLISQLLLALLLIYPASSLLSLASDDPNSSDQLFTALLPLIQQFASLHEIAASLLPASRKRKRSPSQLSDPDPGREEAVEARISLAGLLKEVPCSGSGSASGGSSSSGA
ncbi:hypothetical protein SAY86_024653 [Trapa natans]|uniref:Uncharacterized protein n=1 Tax=Trapa natans TaxID=22666 RepID=A0AAN7LZL1_TRANT|nr:hypothetical protein SAY86_024653 [Trapa natans]